MVFNFGFSQEYSYEFSSNYEVNLPNFKDFDRFYKMEYEMESDFMPNTLAEVEKKKLENKHREIEYLILSPKVKKKKCFISKNEKIEVEKKYDFLLTEATFFAKTEPNVNNTIYVDNRIIWKKENGEWKITKVISLH